MRIRKSEEILVLTQSEKAILKKAYEILDSISEECEVDGDIEMLSGEAKTDIDNLLDDAEIEGGEPSGAITVTIIM